jgi:hypothetical protein
MSRKNFKSNIMENTIDILCVIDAETLANNIKSGTLSPGTLENPTWLGANSNSDVYVFMITQGSFVVNNQTKSELMISAKVGDNVRWGITSPASGVDYSCMLYNFQTGSVILTTPFVLPLSVVEYINNPANPAQILSLSYTNSVWQSTVTAVGSVQYSWSFQLIDQNGNVLGYFSWDPFINIAQ